jgi:hypothetical protein
VHSYALLPIGYPMGRFGPVRRIPLADVVNEDRWGRPYRDPNAAWSAICQSLQRSALVSAQLPIVAGPNERTLTRNV